MEHGSEITGQKFISDHLPKYYISNLKPGEKKFLGAALLMKKNLAKVDVKYRIKSDQSDGKLNGMVAYSKNHDC